MAKRKSTGWTLERRYRQSLMIREWRPWEKSTGPRSVAGKARSSLNGCTADSSSEGFNRKVEVRARRLAALEAWRARFDGCAEVTGPHIQP